MDQIVLELMESQTKKIELLNQVLISTQKQKELIEKDDIENLLLEIEKRQKYLNELLLLKEYQERLQQISSLKLKTEYTVADTGLSALEEEIERLCNSIDTLNSENSLNAQNKLEEYRTDLAEHRKRRKGFASYTQKYIMQDGIYIDKKK